MFVCLFFYVFNDVNVMLHVYLFTEVALVNHVSINKDHDYYH